MIYTARHSPDSGCYRSTPATWPCGLDGAASHLFDTLSTPSGNTLQWLCDPQAHALIVTRTVPPTDNDRGYSESVGLLFEEAEATLLMKQPLRLIHLAHWALAQGPDLPPQLEILPPEVLQLEEAPATPASTWTRTQKDAFIILVAAAADPSKDIVYVADGMKCNELLDVLRALSQKEQLRISFSLGYDTACSKELHLIVPALGDPPYQAPPIATRYTPPLTHEAVLRLFGLTSAAGRTAGELGYDITQPEGLRRLLAPPPAQPPLPQTQTNAPRRCVSRPRRNWSPLLEVIRRVLLLAAAAVLLLWGLRGSRVGEDLYLLIALRGDDLVTLAAAFAAGFLSRPVFSPRRRYKEE